MGSKGVLEWTAHEVVTLLLRPGTYGDRYYRCRAGATLDPTRTTLVPSHPRPCPQHTRGESREMTCRARCLSFVFSAKHLHKFCIRSAARSLVNTARHTHIPPIDLPGVQRRYSIPRPAPPPSCEVAKEETRGLLPWTRISRGGRESSTSALVGGFTRAPPPTDRVVGYPGGTRPVLTLPTDGASTTDGASSTDGALTTNQGTGRYRGVGTGEHFSRRASHGALCEGRASEPLS